MDAVKFLKERDRVCWFYGDWCVGCPASNISDASACAVDIKSQVNADEQVKNR